MYMRHVQYVYMYQVYMHKGVADINKCTSKLM